MSDPDSRSSSPPDPAAPEETLRDAASRVAELRAYAEHYLAAKIDGLRLMARRAALLTVLGVIALVVALTILVTAAALLIVGASQGIAAALGGRVWAGNLIVGVAIVGGLTLAAWLGMKRMFASSRRKTVERYERRLETERSQHGHDARQRSDEFASESR